MSRQNVDRVVVEREHGANAVALADQPDRVEEPVRIAPGRRIPDQCGAVPCSADQPRVLVPADDGETGVDERSACRRTGARADLDDQDRRTTRVKGP